MSEKNDEGKIEMDKPYVHIGVIENVDHSKTTLKAAIEMVLEKAKEGKS